MALKKTIGLLNAKIKDLELRLSTYTDNTDDTRQTNKKINDVLYNLNTKGREPRQDTLIKYNIIYDDVKKKYVKAK
jgi:hypothetical protein